MGKGNSNNGKFKQDAILGQFARDRKGSIENSAVMQCKRASKKLFTKETVRMSFAKDVM